MWPEVFAMKFTSRLVWVLAALLLAAPGAFAQDRRDVRIADDIGRC